MSAYLHEIETRIAGIPCLIGVVDWVPFIEAQTSGPSHMWAAEEGGYGEWKVLDRSGRPAPWLEKKLTPMEYLRINTLLFDEIEG